MTKLNKLLLLVLMSLTLGACATTTMATVETDPDAGDPSAVCAVWHNISWSSSDTDQTIREVRANNRARKAWCGS